MTNTWARIGGATIAVAVTCVLCGAGLLLFFMTSKERVGQTANSPDGEFRARVALHLTRIPTTADDVVVEMRTGSSMRWHAVFEGEDEGGGGKVRIEWLANRVLLIHCHGCNEYDLNSWPSGVLILTKETSWRDVVVRYDIRK